MLDRKPRVASISDVVFSPCRAGCAAADAAAAAGDAAVPAPDAAAGRLWLRSPPAGCIPCPARRVPSAAADGVPSAGGPPAATAGAGRSAPTAVGGGPAAAAVWAGAGGEARSHGLCAAAGGGVLGCSPRPVQGAQSCLFCVIDYHSLGECLVGFQVFYGIQEPSGWNLGTSPTVQACQAPISLSLELAMPLCLLCHLEYTATKDFGLSGDGFWRL